VDHAAALLDDAVDRGQAQARAPARLLGGVEGLEDALAGVGVHADAVVRDPEADVVAADRVQGELPRLVVAQMHVGGLDAEAAAGGHGVSGVHHQVHDHLLKHGAVGGDSNRILADLQLKFMPFSEKRVEEVAGADALRGARRPAGREETHRPDPHGVAGSSS